MPLLDSLGGSRDWLNRSHGHTYLLSSRKMYHLWLPFVGGLSCLQLILGPPPAPSRKEIRCLRDDCHPRDSNSLVWDGSVCPYPSCFSLLSPWPASCTALKFRSKLAGDGVGLIHPFLLCLLQTQAHRHHSFAKMSPGLCQNL